MVIQNVSGHEAENNFPVFLYDSSLNLSQQAHEYVCVCFSKCNHERGAKTNRGWKILKEAALNQTLQKTAGGNA